MAVVMISLGAQIAGELLGSTNELINGAVIVLNALTIGAAAMQSDVANLSPKAA